MGKIVLISCASKKLDERVEAKDLYVSPLFKYNLKYARSLHPDKIFILSAKYGLLKLEDKVGPYNTTLNDMKDAEIRTWSINVLEQLKKEANLEQDKFIFLAGEKYRRHLAPQMKNYQIPLKGLGIGKQLKYLKEHTR